MLLSFHQAGEKWFVNAGRLRENITPSEWPRGCRAQSRTGPWQAGRKGGQPGPGVQPPTFLCSGQGRDQSPGAPLASSPALSTLLQLWAITAALSPSRSREGAAPPRVEAMSDTVRAKGCKSTPGIDPAGASPELYAFSSSIDHPWLKSGSDSLNTWGLCSTSGTF